MIVAAKKRAPEATAQTDADDLVPFAFRIERGIITGLDEIVADMRREFPAFRGLTRSDIIRAALRDAIDKHRAAKVAKG